MHYTARFRHKEQAEKAAAAAAVAAAANTKQELEEYKPEAVKTAPTQHYMPSYQPTSNSTAPSAVYKTEPQADNAVRESQQNSHSVRQSSNVTLVSKAEPTDTSDQSISWPPRTDDSPPVKAPALQQPANTRMTSPVRPPGTTPVRPTAIVPSRPQMQSPVRPPQQSNVRVITQQQQQPRTTLAPHIQVQSPAGQMRSPIRTPGMRPQQRPQQQIGNVRVMPSTQYNPQPQQQLGRRISAEAQQDALNMLDDIHAQTHPNKHIQILGQQNISPVPQRNVRNIVRAQQIPPAQPMSLSQQSQPRMQRHPGQQQFGYNNMRPPVKRPYQQQQYSNNQGYFY